MKQRAVIVMGVSGSGKSTVGALLAAQIHLPFIEGDDLHTKSGKAKMASGIPLDDADRAPWLDAIAAVLHQAPSVIACSALKRRYRDRLRAASADVRFIYLAGSASLLAARLKARAQHFMPASLLESQLATLEPPDPDENALTLDIQLPAEQIAARAAHWLDRAEQ